MLDVAITGGTLVDGTGAPARRADVGVAGGRVVAVTGPGGLDEGAARTVDATGLVVTPGFVDVHTHYDAQVLWDPLATPSTLHGVTTVVGGNCGFTVAPITDDAAGYVLPMLARVEGMPLDALRAGLDLRWSSFGSWLDRLEGALAVNAGFLVGHSTIRRVVMGEDAVGGRPSPAQLDAMVRLVHESVAGGALGFSSSVVAAHNDHRGDPVPSRAADLGELLALCGALADHPGTTLEFNPTMETYFSEADCERMTAMSLAAGGRALNWNLMTVRPGEADQRATKLAASDHAAARGARVVALTLPEVMRMRLNLLTGVMYDTIPGWGEVMALPFGEKVAALRDETVRRHLAERAATPGQRSWAQFATTTIGDVSSAALAGLAGRTVGDVAAERGQDVFDTFLDVALADDLRTGFYPDAPGDDDETWAARADVWRDPRVVLGGSDAGAHLDMMTTFKCTTVFLAHAVRERGLLPLEEGVRLVTDVPARLYGLAGRGRVVPGAAADLVVLDYERLAPGPVEMRHDLPGGAMRLYGEAVGVEQVLVNGRVVLDGGTPTGDRPGTVLRAGRDLEAAGR